MPCRHGQNGVEQRLAVSGTVGDMNGKMPLAIRAVELSSSTKETSFLLCLGLHLRKERLYPQNAAEDAPPADPLAAKSAFSNVCGHLFDIPLSESIVKGHYRQVMSVLVAVRQPARGSQGLVTGSLIARYYLFVLQRDDSKRVCLRQGLTQGTSYSPTVETHSPQRRPAGIVHYSPARARSPLNQQLLMSSQQV